jgi:alginate O-acetyltransferase complex protein AlgI
MLLGGLWHGAGWNFVLWGGAHGLGLMVNKRFGKIRLPFFRHIRTIGWLATYIFVLLTWVPFRAPSFHVTGEYIKYMFTPNHGGIPWIHLSTFLIIGLLGIWHVAKHYDLKVTRIFPQAKPALGTFAIGIFILTGLLLFAPTETSPFIYFQF